MIISPAQRIARRLVQDLPDLQFGRNIVAGPIFPYETSLERTDHFRPKSIFVMDDGGLADAHMVGGASITRNRGVQLRVRSGKSKTDNTGSIAGAYEDGLRLAQACENAIRSAGTIDGLIIDIYTPMQYVGMSEDDMHFWTMNLRTRECASSYDVYYGRSATIDSSIFDSGDSVKVFGFHRSYSNDQESDSPFVAIPTEHIGSDSFSVALESGGIIVNESPTVETVEDYTVYSFSHDDSDYKIVIK